MIQITNYWSLNFPFPHCMFPFPKRSSNCSFSGICWVVKTFTNMSYMTWACLRLFGLLKSGDCFRRTQWNRTTLWQCCPFSPTTCAVLMLHSSWNNPTVFQTPKWTPKLDSTLPQRPHTPLCPGRSPVQYNPPTQRPLLPYTHPLVSCPYLGRDVLSAVWRWGLARGGGEGVGLTQGRQEEKQRALAALSL